MAVNGVHKRMHKICHTEVSLEERTPGAKPQDGETPWLSGRGTCGCMQDEDPEEPSAARAQRSCYARLKTLGFSLRVTWQLAWAALGLVAM